MSQPQFKPAPFFRRLGAYVYDALISAAIFMFAGALGTLVGWVLLKLRVIELGEYPDLGGYMADNIVYQGWLLLVFCGFFIWFWTHGGQTLGMRAWRVKVIDKDTGGPVTFTRACIRLITATLGLSNLLAPIDPNKQGLQDLMAGTQLVLLKKPEKPVKPVKAPKGKKAKAEKQS